MRITILILYLLFLMYPGLRAQGFLKAEGDRIVNGEGENFIIRSIGTGNWMIQEGYMMKTAGIAGTQHEFRKRLEESIGIARTDSFYISWLENHFNRRDLDSMKAWGFNAVRPALHYKWFTLPIEEEPVPGEQTWLETGFRLTDSLVKWCSENEMYVIFDMHGAPGGQGKNADISDYDDSKPSLWESDENKTKLVALWYKIAERYSDEPWVGGYDLINETNWEFQEGGNAPLRKIYERITDTIRRVDQNHILFIEGNWFANDFSGLTPPWDDNMVYSFHKYWTFNTPNSLDFATWLREEYNVPLWLGESGENSNTWFTNLIALAENQNIGWSWWPVKKAGLNNVLQVKANSDYLRLVDSWKGEADPMRADDAYRAVMTFSENHRLENCIVQYDVIDAMIRQPHTTKLKPFKIHAVSDHIFAVDYALGRNNYAYFDTDTANYHGDEGEYTQWNTGGHYRNDGVDIERCSDADTTNGFSVGWIEDGEWLSYHLRTDSSMKVDAIFRTASASGRAYAVLEVNGEVISDLIYLPPTGGWNNWRSTSAGKILLPAGDNELTIRVLKGNVNLNYLKFENTGSAAETDFTHLLAETAGIENEIILNLNKPVTVSELSIEDFSLDMDGEEIAVKSLIPVIGEKQVIIIPESVIPQGSVLELSYKGGSIFSGEEALPAFQDKVIHNNIIEYHPTPGKIEAEVYYRNSGFRLEDCQDEGGGVNTAYAHPGDYLDYILFVQEPGNYRCDMRVALQNGNARVEFQVLEEGKFVSKKVPTLFNTGGWQQWATQPTSINLPQGKVILRLKVLDGEFNLNWLNLSLITAKEEQTSMADFSFYPNPAQQALFIQLYSNPFWKTLSLYDLKGNLLIRRDVDNILMKLNISSIPDGVYVISIHDNQQVLSKKLLINR